MRFPDVGVFGVLGVCGRSGSMGSIGSIGSSGASQARKEAHITQVWRGTQPPKFALLGTSTPTNEVPRLRRFRSFGSLNPCPNQLWDCSVGQTTADKKCPLCHRKWPKSVVTCFGHKNVKDILGVTSYLTASLASWASRVHITFCLVKILLPNENRYSQMFLFSSRYKWCKTITWENFDWNKKTSRTRLIVIMCSSAKNNNCNSCICLRCQRLVMANLVTSNSPVRIVPSSPEVSRGTVISS